MTTSPHETNGIEKPTDLAPEDRYVRSPDDDSQYEEEEQGVTLYPKRRKSTVGSDMVFVLAAMALFAALMSTPSCVWAVRHWNDSTVPVAQGTVQRINFIGNLGIDTQIDTEQRSFIVHGITKLKKGTRVETRKGTWAYALCDQDTDLCEDLVREE